jgi:hypothetical protein
MPVPTVSTFGSKIRSVRGEPHLVDEQPVGARADLDAALERVGLALLVERHDDDRRPVAAHECAPGQELRLALLERDRVDDALALEVLEARLEDRPRRRVEHHRHPRHVGLGRQQAAGTPPSSPGRRSCPRRS